MPLPLLLPLPLPPVLLLPVLLPPLPLLPLLLPPLPFLPLPLPELELLLLLLLAAATAAKWRDGQAGRRPAAAAGSVCVSAAWSACEQGREGGGSRLGANRASHAWSAVGRGCGRSPAASWAGWRDAARPPSCKHAPAGPRTVRGRPAKPAGRPGAAAGAAGGATTWAALAPTPRALSARRTSAAEGQRTLGGGIRGQERCCCPAMLRAAPRPVLRAAQASEAPARLAHTIGLVAINRGGRSRERQAGRAAAPTVQRFLRRRARLELRLAAWWEQPACIPHQPDTSYNMSTSVNNLQPSKQGHFRHMFACQDERRWLCMPNCSLRSATIHHSWKPCS